MTRRPRTTMLELIAAGDDPASLDRLDMHLLKLKRTAEALAGELRDIAELLEWQRSGETLSRPETSALNCASQLHGALRQIRRHTTTICGTEEQCAAFDEKLRPFVEAMRYSARPKDKHRT